MQHKTARYWTEAFFPYEDRTQLPHTGFGNFYEGAIGAILILADSDCADRLPIASWLPLFESRGFGARCGIANHSFVPRLRAFPERSDVWPGTNSEGIADQIRVVPL